MTKIENMHRQKVDKSRILSKKGKLGLQNTPLLNHQREFVAPPKRSLVFRRKRFFFPLPRLVVLRGGVHCSLSCRRCLGYSGLHLCSRLSLSTFLSRFSLGHWGTRTPTAFTSKQKATPKVREQEKTKRSGSAQRFFSVFSSDLLEGHDRVEGLLSVALSMTMAKDLEFQGESPKCCP